METKFFLLATILSPVVVFSPIASDTMNSQCTVRRNPLKHSLSHRKLLCPPQHSEDGTRYILARVSSDSYTVYHCESVRKVSPKLTNSPPILPEDFQAGEARSGTRLRVPAFSRTIEEAANVHPALRSGEAGQPPP